MKFKLLAASICLIASAQMAQAGLVDFYGVGNTKGNQAAKDAEDAFKGALTSNTLAGDSLEDPSGSRGWNGDVFSSSSIPLIFRPGFDVNQAATNSGSTLGGTNQMDGTGATSSGRSAHLSLIHI